MVAQSTVAKYVVKRRGPASQSWRTFPRNHATEIAAVDLFMAPTIGFDLLYGLVIVTLVRRHLVWVNVTANPTAEWIARRVTEVFPWDEAPHYLVRDRDGVYGVAFHERLRAMGIRDHPVATRSPWQNPYAERLIGSIRRDCHGHIVVLGEAHLRRILKAYAIYYNRARVHRSLRKDCPRPSSHRDERHHDIDADSWRSPSRLLTDVIFGTHKPRHCGAYDGRHCAGFCFCYDLGNRRGTDRLTTQFAKDDNNVSQIAVRRRGARLRHFRFG